MRVYYAHCMNIYNTKQEERDLELLKSLGFEIINPNLEEHQNTCQHYRNPMDYFVDLVNDHAEALAFRALPNGQIPAGVYKEIQTALHKSIPVFELPVNVELRNISVEHTRAWLKELGQR